jgi:hypothetical protein
MPLGLDFLTQIVNIKLGDIDEQGLLAIDPFGSLHAVALDTGELFPGISTGATGNGFTVLTPGVVVFGKPRDGDACFMGCIDGKTILRGTQDTNRIAWLPVYSVPRVDGFGLTALSFAKGAFFVNHFSSDRSLHCAVSFDGFSFAEIGNIFSGVPLLDAGGTALDQNVSGAVAHNGKTYAAAGRFDPERPPGTIVRLTADYSMIWSSSSNGTDWSSGYSPNEITNPGADPNGTAYSGSSVEVFYTNIAGGAGLFVSAATTREGPFFVVEPTITTMEPTASAAVSSDGSSWETIRLPGVIHGAYSYVDNSNSASRGESVAFIKTKKDGDEKGYFLISSYGRTQVGSVGTVTSWCHRGDGHTWALVRSEGVIYGAVSAIAKDLATTTIVYLR